MRMRVAVCAGMLWVVAASGLRAQGTEARVLVPAASVAAALTAAGLASAPDQIRLPMPIRAFTAAPKIDVRSAEMRPDGSLRLRLACRDARECMPFFVEVDLPNRSKAMAALAGVHPADNVPMAATAAGVMAGGRVTLQLGDDRMRLQFPAISIDAGAPGAEVRVASVDRKHVYHGVVVDRSTVKGDLD